MVTGSTLFKPKTLRGFAQRGHRRPKRPPKRLRPLLTVKQILAWADTHHKRTGKWPQASLRQVHEAPTETWTAVNAALSVGYRGLPGGSSLAKLLTERRGVRNSRALPRLSIKHILAWADAHRKRTGKWPNLESGRIYGVPLSETWWAVDKALKMGKRGMAAGTSLARLLVDRRGIRSQIALPGLSVEQILAWADAHYKRTGKWPNSVSGQVCEQPSETWNAINLALREGYRGLRGGRTLAQLLIKHRGMRSRHVRSKRR